MAIKEKIKEIKEKTQTKVKEVSDKTKDFYEEHKLGIGMAIGYTVAGAVAIMAERLIYGGEAIECIQFGDDTHYTYAVESDEEEQPTNYMRATCYGGLTAKTNRGRTLTVPMVRMEAILDDHEKQFMIDELSNLPE